MASGNKYFNYHGEIGLTTCIALLFLLTLLFYHACQGHARKVLLKMVLFPDFVIKK